MERLTKKLSSGKWFVLGSQPSAIDRLAYYEDLEEQGRLAVLPCAVGATVYGNHLVTGEVVEYKVSVISLATYNWYLGLHNHDSDFWITDVDIGKTVFLTREEAEAALKG